jgi:hypothetical protein
MTTPPFNPVCAGLSRIEVALHASRVGSPRDAGPECHWRIVAVNALDVTLEWWGRRGHGHGHGFGSKERESMGVNSELVNRTSREKVDACVTGPPVHPLGEWEAFMSEGIPNWIR